jgi:hypothetical protein
VTDTVTVACSVLLAGVVLFSAKRNRKEIRAMSDNVTADLNAAVETIKTAVGDAAKAIQDQAAKLGSMSSVNPADVENAAQSLNQIAAGLEAVVAAAGEAVTQAPQPEPPPPAASVAEGAEPNPPGSTTAGDAPAEEPVSEPQTAEDTAAAVSEDEGLTGLSAEQIAEASAEQPAA